MFFDCYRMNQDTYEYILNAISLSIGKFSNFRKTIPPEERLSVTPSYTIFAIINFITFYQ